jgi:RNA ligase (TIGR02306 family)
MSDIAITIEQIAGIEPHPQADRLEIAKILGTQTIVPKGQYRVGEPVVYFPPDICLPEDEANWLGVFKYLKSGGRVAACRLRGVPSYGFVTPVPPRLASMVDHPDADLTEHYRAWKYEPPVRVYRGHGGGTGEVWGSLAREPENFHHYTDIQAYWKHHREFEDGILVRVTEKIHGTNSRVGLLKVRDEWDFYAGSHKKCRRGSDHEGRECVYWHPFNIPGVMDLLTDLCNLYDWGMESEGPQNDVILFGELFGPGVQDLDYGVTVGEIGWRCYDCMVNGQYLDWPILVAYCLAHGVQMVPVIYSGPFKANLVESWTNGPSTVSEAIKSKFKGREGCVITPHIETRTSKLGRLILKSVSADYRDRKGASDEGEL